MRKTVAAAAVISGLAICQIFGNHQLIVETDVCIKDIHCCDLDGNDYQDIIVCPYLEGDMFVIMNSSTGFSDTQPIPYTGINVRSADFNGDGLDDLVTGFQGPVLFSNGDGTFTPSSYVIRQSAVPEDFNGDGMPDLLMAEGPVVFLALNQNWGESFIDVWSDTLPTWPGVSGLGFMTGNVNGDDLTDIVAIHNYGLRVFTAQGSPTTFSLAETEDDLYTYLIGPPPYSVCDIDGNQRPDLLHSGWDMGVSPPAPVHISVWEDDPGEWYWTRMDIPAESYPTVDGCDFDGDGYDEVFYSNYSGLVVLSGTSSGPGSILFQATTPDFSQAVSHGLLNGDANPDLIFADDSSVRWYPNQLTSVSGSTRPVIPGGISIKSNPLYEPTEISSSFAQEYILLDHTGRKVGGQSGNTYYLDPGLFPAGMYSLVVRGSGQSFTERLVILR